MSIQKYEKRHREGRAETYSLPWFLKSKVQGACWSFWYDCTFSSCVYLSPADQTPWPLHFPRAQSRGDIPWPSGGSLSPHNYSANLFPSGQSEWPTHWKSNLSWVQPENTPSCAQEQSFLFHPKSFLQGNAELMALSEMNHQPSDKVLWITLWGWHKIGKSKWPDQCEILFQLRRKRDTLLCTVNRRTNAYRCNICHKQGSNSQHCSKRQLPSPYTHLRFWDTQQDLKLGEEKRGKKEGKKDPNELAIFNLALFLEDIS